MKLLGKKFFTITTLFMLHILIYHIGVKFNSAVLGNSDTFSKIDYESFFTLSLLIWCGAGFLFIIGGMRFLFFLFFGLLAFLILSGILSYLSSSVYFDEYMFETMYYIGGVFYPLSIGMTTVLLNLFGNIGAKEFSFLFYLISVTQLSFYSVLMFYVYCKILKLNI